jgi:hypothetical protein
MTTTHIVTCGDHQFNVSDLTVAFYLFKNLPNTEGRLIKIKYTYFKYDRRVLRYMDSIYFISEAA